MNSYDSYSRDPSPSRRPATRPPNIYTPPASQPITASRFSPESPPPPPPPKPTTRASLFSGRRSSSRTRESMTTGPTPIFSKFSKHAPSAPMTEIPLYTVHNTIAEEKQPSTKRESKFAKVWFDLRTMGHHREQSLPTHQRPLYLVEKGQPETEQAPRKTSKQKIILIVVLVILLLSLIGNVVLSIRLAVSNKTTVVVNPSGTNTSTNSTGDSTPSSSSSSGLSHDQQQCVDQFTLNAAAAPASYPSSTCAGVLAGVNLDQVSNTTLRQQVTNALDFSGLKGIYDAASSAGQSALFNQGWLEDTRFCTWQSVVCDSTSGRVISLRLVTPAVPQRLPDELVALMALQTFSITGDNSLPAGPIPSSFTALTNLKDLHIEATDLASFSGSTFSSFKSLTSVTLVNNGDMNSVPESLFSLPLKTLIVNGQPAPSPSNILSSPTLQQNLNTLDLSRTSLSSSLPDDWSALTALTELHLANAGISGSFPSKVPGTLVVLDASGNGELGGNLPSALCASGVLKSCSLQGTEFGVLAAGSCGPCQFA